LREADLRLLRRWIHEPRLLCGSGGGLRITKRL
jgi:hypothetical protein